jgi:hypothetical protein
MGCAGNSKPDAVGAGGRVRPADQRHEAPAGTTTKLLSADEFAGLLSEPGQDEAIAAYAAALARVAEAVASDEESTRLLFQAADERDAALARVAELETEVELRRTMANQAMAIVAERDALADELSELRRAVTELFGCLDEQETNCAHATVSQVRTCPTCAAVVEGYVNLCKLAAQPQGERGAQILKRHDWLLGRLMAMNTVRLSQGLVSAEFLRLWELTLNEFAALDGAQL